MIGKKRVGFVLEHYPMQTANAGLASLPFSVVRACSGSILNRSLGSSYLNFQIALCGLSRLYSCWRVTSPFLMSITLIIHFTYPTDIAIYHQGK